MSQNFYDLIIIGSGPAGLMAAIESYNLSRKILILEKMPKPALKLRISGKGRCNITNSADMDEFISHFGKNGRFLKFAFSKFFNKDILKYFEDIGVQFKLERGGRYFPQTDNAIEITNALLNKVHSLKIPVYTDHNVKHITKLPKDIFRISVKNMKGELSELDAGRIVIATGGKSYPKTGSDGSGYSLADSLGHKITPVIPSLVPIETKDDTAKKLQGLSLKNVKASVWCNNKKIIEQFGEMLFTDKGLSGPIILSLSKTVVILLKDKQKVTIYIDLKPALDHKKLDQRLLREINDHSKKTFKNLLKQLLPNKLIQVFLDDLNILESKQLSQISSDERKRLRNLLKQFVFEVKGHGSFDQAIVTSGGISINEINPQTMESKIIKGLYFAGEIIDIDADTGGYNLQAAFSTGWIAGRAIKDSFNY